MYKLLIVDDEPAIRTLIAKYAVREGYECEEAENGMEAVEKCKQNNYDLVILDIMMPELDGFSAGRQIKRTIRICRSFCSPPEPRNTTGSTGSRSAPTITS